MKHIMFTLRVALFNVLICGVSSFAQPNVSFTTLVAFNGTNNGGNPDGNLIQGSDGNFYGTTRYGGRTDIISGGYGTVFRMTPEGALTTLVAFSQTNGAYPEAPVVQGNDGNLYGTTQRGGTNGNGTVFCMTTNGVLNYVVSLTKIEGGNLDAGLTQGSDGNFYGVAINGGPNPGLGQGTIFKMALDGTVSNFFSFGLILPRRGVGSLPEGELVEGRDGNFYGATAFAEQNQFGSLYKIGKDGTFATLYTFTTGGGHGPTGPLVSGPDGNFYGMTKGGGTYGWGTVFQMSTNGTLTSLLSFNGTNGSVQYYGASPDAFARGLVQGSDGNFYGETVCGGPAFTGSSYGTGTLFQITTNGVLTTLYSFGGVVNDGAYPVGGLIQAQDGTFYGVTFNGGTNGFGTIFRLNVPLKPTIQTLALTNGTISFVWNAAANRSYQVQFTTNLISGDWENLGDLIPATNGIAGASDSIGPNSQCFYRVLLVQ